MPSKKSWFKCGAKYNAEQELWEADSPIPISLISSNMYYAMVHTKGSGASAEYVYRIKDKDGSVVDALRAGGMTELTKQEVKDEMATGYGISDERIDQEDAE